MKLYNVKTKNLDPFLMNLHYVHIPQLICYRNMRRVKTWESSEEGYQRGNGVRDISYSREESER